MKNILLLILFSTFLFSSTQSFTQSKSSTYIDIDKKYTLETIASIKKDFQAERRSIHRFSDKVIWSYFTISNNSSKKLSLIVYNAIRLLRYADVLVVYKDGTKQNYMIGTDRYHKLHSLGVIGYHLELKAGEYVEIYTKHNPIGLLSTHWNVKDEKKYYIYKSMEDSVLGILFGVIFLILLYGFTLFYITREKSNLFFNGLIVARTFLALAISGYFYTYSYDVGVLIRTGINIYIPMIVIFESLFFISLYDLKKKSSKYYSIFSTIAIVGIIFVLLAIYNIFNTPSAIAVKAMIVYVAIYTISSLIFTTYATYKRWKGSSTLLLSVLVFIFARYSYIKSFNENSELMLLFLAIVILETLLIFITLTLKVKEIYDEKVKARTIILNHAKYLSLGKMHAATIHQLRTPIAHIGAIASRISFVFELHKHQLAEEEYSSAYELESIVAMANNTVSDLYNLYSTDQEKEYFDIKEAIQEILLLINSKSQNHSISVNTSLESAPTLNYPNSLKHIFMIIMENAIDILNERNISNPTINIFLKGNKENYELSIYDNAKGIMIEPIEDVFEMYKSSKKTKGLGLGLALAKDLSNFSGTQLSAFNTKEGACFRIIFPQA